MTVTSKAGRWADGLTRGWTRVRHRCGWLDVRSGRGRLLARVTDPRLHGPSTAAFDGRDLLVVNFQYGAASPVLPYTVVRLTPDRGRPG
ncbi:hypothetical protein HS048_17010 [Planomonospora sp. ID91781]|uniref:hypothetical protein n=1 Tax=Planomonospora sp. ID91781 TaxID=2738135 RepID=UPI0018C44A49|nr:hypothetical protein [Planomonospora sp. ID91781]MBG0822444.1 hypothetical protein [Planomonospora sp. ID91781]